MTRHRIIITLLSVAYCLDLAGQANWVEVRNEERHHLVFENSYVRILNVFIGPGDTSRYHRHNTPSVFIQLSQNKVGSQLLGQPPVLSENIFGRWMTFDSLNRQRIHRVWNRDTIWMHVMDVEITAAIPPGKIKPVRLPSLSLDFAEEKLNGYLLKLDPQGSFHVTEMHSPCLLVSLQTQTISLISGKTTLTYFLQAGHYFWFNANEDKIISNNTEHSVEFALLQFGQ